MARLQAWDPFDLRAIDLFAQYDGANNRTNDTDTEIVQGGRVYDSALILEYGAGRNRTALEFYGDGITVAEGGGVTGGRINAIFNWFVSQQDGEWYYNILLDEFDISAIDLVEAQLTVSRTDDSALLNQILGAADTIDLSMGKDWMDGHGGNDTIRGYGGDDTLLGGAGDDRIFAAKGRDRLTGGDGDDELDGGGRDRATDRFIFDADDGVDVISGFEDGRDRIVISDGADRFVDLDIDRVGAGSRVTFGDTVVYVSGIRPADLTAGDFIFA